MKKKKTQNVKEENSREPEICRACLTNNSERRQGEQYKIISLNEPLLIEMFSFCTSLQISQDDKLTKSICSVCLALLEKLYKFKNQCIESDSILRNSRETIPTDVEKDTGSLKQDAIEIEYDNSDIKKEDEYEDNMYDDPFVDTGSEYNVDIKPKIEKIITLRPKLLRKGKKESKSAVDPDYFPSKDKNIISTKISKEKLMYNCSQCDRKFIYLKSLKSHEDVHTYHKLGQFPCNICGTSRSIRCAKKHKSLVHSKSVEELTCGICNAVFDSVKKVKKHINAIHDNQCVCPRCGLTLPNKRSYYSHIKMHQEKKKRNEEFECKLCSKKLPTKSSLRWHLILHEEKKIACELCDSKFHYKNQLKMHVMRRHTGVKYECHICHNKYSTKAFLKVHIRTHTGEKPYICKVCSVGFISTERLTEHMRTHTGEKPYVCEICNHAFAQVGTKNRHRLTHNNVQPSPKKKSKPQPSSDT